jgi:hypothetical protein
MSIDKSNVVSELAELYEFCLNIGTSLDSSINASTFFTSFAQRKNIKYISVLECKKDALYLKESFPEILSSEQTIGTDSPLCKYFKILEEGKIHRIEQENFSFAGFDAPYLWLYYSEDVYILFLQNEQDSTFSGIVRSQLAPVLKKFSISMKAHSIFIKVDANLVNLKFDEILWMEALGDYVGFHTSEKRYVVKVTLAYIEKRIAKKNFARVHRSFMVNTDKIKMIDDSSLVINEKLIPISRGSRAGLLESINLLK